MCFGETTPVYTKPNTRIHEFICTLGKQLFEYVRK